MDDRSYAENYLAEFVEPAGAYDATGVGGPVTEDLRAMGLAFHSVTITGAQARERRLEDEPDAWSVPKRDLVARARVLIDTGRLKIAERIPFAGALVEELLNVQYDTTPAGNHVFRHREGEHDDLVLALCLALWDAAKGARGEIDPSLATTGTRVKEGDLENLDDWFLEAPDRGDGLLDRDDPQPGLYPERTALRPRPWHLDLR